MTRRGLARASLVGLTVLLASACSDSSGEGPGGEKTFVPTARLTLADGTPNDQFGVAVAIEGRTVVVGAHQKTIDGKFAQGAAYVFTRRIGSDEFRQVATLSASDGQAEHGFGWAVSLSGDTIVVAAPFADAGAGGTAIVAGAIRADVGEIEQGAAYVFLRPEGGWVSMTESQKLVGSDSSDGRFGFSVSTDGHWIAAGAPSSGGESPGAAYLFASSRRR